MRWFLPLLLVCACDGEPSCEDVYEEYVAHVRARFDSCDLEFDVDATPLEPCDDTAKEAILCLDDCVSLLSCGALTGSNASQSRGYSECTLACPPVQ